MRSSKPWAHDARWEVTLSIAEVDLVTVSLRALVTSVSVLMERQALGRVEDGSLSNDQIERIGSTLMALEARMARCCPTISGRFPIRGSAAKRPRELGFVHR
jgi:hypothetical protein